MEITTTTTRTASTINAASVDTEVKREWERKARKRH